MGERIRQLWVESGEQQDEFVKALGISTVTLANYMSGKRKPDSEFLFFLKKIKHLHRLALNRRREKVSFGFSARVKDYGGAILPPQ